eukprot:SAG31_NODE_23274_length_507_cov_1.247549_1_plen_98_part_01
MEEKRDLNSEMSVVLQVGQAGNAIGGEFWKVLSAEAQRRQTRTSPPPVDLFDQIGNDSWMISGGKIAAATRGAKDGKMPEATGRALRARVVRDILEFL